MRSRLGGSASRLKAPDDGIVASSRGGGWVMERWQSMFKPLLRTHGSRISKGRNLARNGRVRGLWFSPGLASAQVVADDHYNVSIRFKVFKDAHWKRILDALLEDLQHVGALLEGELNLSLVHKLEASGIHLIPELDEIDGDCDCDDYMLPCAHMAAVHQVLAEALDGEPFLLFTLRGRPRAQLLKEMRKAWGDTSLHRPVPLEEEPDVDRDWFRSPHALRGGNFRFRLPEKLGMGLRALGPPPGDVDLLRALGPLYEAGSQVALELALEEIELNDEARERQRNFRRNTQRPVGKDRSGSSSQLTERLVDLLADVENMKSKDLAIALGANITDVRNELLELERLGIVYRTGQTRATRWWLG